MPYANWHYINTKVNPADIATRARSVKELQNEKLWWKGPPNLSQTTDPWPTATIEQEARLEEPVSLVISHAIETDSWFIDRFSSLSRQIQITTIVIKYNISY